VGTLLRVTSLYVPSLACRDHTRVPLNADKFAAVRSAEIASSFPHADAAHDSVAVMVSTSDMRDTLDTSALPLTVELHHR
jgi:hypothetical protein